MDLRFSVLALLALLALPVQTLAQTYTPPTPEESAERVKRAKNAPLFQSHDPLRLTLRTNIAWLRDERSDSIEVAGTVRFVDKGLEIVKPVDTRARGERRRDKKICNFPPLRLDFPTGQMEGTVFQNQDKLKLVTPCHVNRGSYQNYVFDEYLAYRTLNLLTPFSFRVRLVEITYEDTEGDYQTRTKFGFLLESEEAMADRNRATPEHISQLHPAGAHGEFSVLVALFNYMIANTDWSPVYFHNVRLIRAEDGRLLTVPYDFDISGVVNPTYAVVDASIGIHSVRQRLFRGFCRDELTYERAVSRFAETRGQVTVLYERFAARGFQHYDENDARDALAFYDRSYEVVEVEDDFDEKILKNCRGMGTGRRR